jgi:putative transposase
MLLDSTFYPSDLTTEQWNLIRNSIPQARPGGRSRTTCMRKVFNAILYLNRTGCAWRYLPKEFPPWQTVYGYYSQWKLSGVFRSLHDRLVKKCRHQAHRNPTPSLLMIDSQSAKAQFGADRGYDGFKKVRGRKRHLITDALGLLHAQKQTAAQYKDHLAGIELIQEPVLKKKLRNLGAFYADGAYRGRFEEQMKKQHHVAPILNVTQMKKKDDRNREARTLMESNLKPKRWIIERTFSWFNHYRRLTRDYERTIQSSESMIHIAMTQLMLKRLLPKQSERNHWKKSLH